MIGHISQLIHVFIWDNEDVLAGQLEHRMFILPEYQSRSRNSCCKLCLCVALLYVELSIGGECISRKNGVARPNDGHVDFSIPSTTERR